MTRRLMVASALMLVLTGCGPFGGGTVGPNAWELDALSPDETQLLVTTRFGGVASGCQRFEGWEVDETADHVEIRAQLWKKDNPSSCTSDGAQASVTVALDAPLGDRRLTGCGSDDCLSTQVLPGGFPGPPQVSASENHVLVRAEGNIYVFDSAGSLLETHDTTTELGDHAESLLRSLVPVGDLFVSTSGSSTTAFDPRNGSIAWSHPGWIQAIDDTDLFVCLADELRGTLSQIDAPSGAVAWAIDASCDFVTVFADTVVVLGRDPAVDGGNELLVIDRHSGDELVRRPFDDGTDDRVNGTRGVTRVGDVAAAFGWQADTVLIDETGSELKRRPERLGVPVGASGDLLITALEQHVIATDVTSGERTWTVDRRHAGGRSGAFIVDGDGVWLPDPGVVTKIDAATGMSVWTTPVSPGAGASLAVTDDVVYVSATFSLTALDRDTGEELWIATLPWAGEVVTPGAYLDGE